MQLYLQVFQDVENYWANSVIADDRKCSSGEAPLMCMRIRMAVRWSVFVNGAFFPIEIFTW